MTELKKCPRCKSEIEVKFFGNNRKGEPYNTCNNCRSNNCRRKTKRVSKLPSSSDEEYNMTMFNRPKSKHEQLKQHYKFQVQDILKPRENNKDQFTDDCCPTCFQSNYKQHTSYYNINILDTK